MSTKRIRTVPHRTPAELKKLPQEVRDALRSDAFHNHMTGLGTTRDKRTHANVHIPDVQFSREWQQDAWRGSAILAKIVEKRTREVLRAGHELHIDDDALVSPDESAYPDQAAKAPKLTRGDAFPPAGGGALVPPPPKKPPGLVEPENDDVAAIKKAATAKLRELGAHEAVRTAADYEEAYGGGALLLGLNDLSGDLSQPLKWESIKRFSFINVLSRWELYALTYYNDPAAPKFGDPETYLITPHMVDAAPLAQGWGTKVVHESRLVVFKGPAVSKLHRRRNHGWGDSRFVRVFEEVRDWDQACSGGSALLQDMSQAVMKVKGLHKMLAMNDDKAIQKKIEQLDMMRSVLKMLLVDADSEDFVRTTTSLAGFSDVLSELKYRVASAADMPVSKLFGDSPSGLSATGDADEESWQQSVDGHWDERIEPAYEKLYRCIFASADGPTEGKVPASFTLKLNPLQKEDASEQADVRQKTAQAVTALVAASVVTPEEVTAAYAEKIFGITVDLDARQQLASDFEDQQAKHEEATAKAAENPPPAAPPAKPVPAKA